MIKVSIQDFDVISRYTLICQHCDKVMAFDEHPFEYKEIQCPMCKTEYFLEEEHDKKLTELEK